MNLDAGLAGELPEAGGDLILRPSLAVTIPKEWALWMDFRKVVEKCLCFDAKWNCPNGAVALIFVASDLYEFPVIAGMVRDELDRLADPATRQ